MLIKIVNTLVKSGYRLAIKNNLNLFINIVPRRWKWLWKLYILLKVKNFLWRVLRGVFPTKNNLRRKSIDVNGYYCNYNEVETVFHVFFQYFFARDY